ncbi:hypothetical protein HY469_00175 [Candidatus Roizmanbacteria bacterium]|nr:hypothetical protein [Candidatus Roizmanbacteria bacterium]
MEYYIKEDFYFDIDHHRQLRITGPENHLLLGTAISRKTDLKIESYEIESGQLVLTLSSPSPSVILSSPLVTDIRTLRNFVESKIPRPTYRELLRKHIAEVFPKITETEKTPDGVVLRFANRYKDTRNTEQIYGAQFEIPHAYTLHHRRKQIIIAGTPPIRFQIRTISSIAIEDKYKYPLFQPSKALSAEIFPPHMIEAYNQAEEQITHLVRAKKTSSFEYGTIFPRDWIESACLGYGDLDPLTIDYMINQSMKNISESGEGWHEEIVGEYRTKTKQEIHVDRKMIDIEPLYIMGLEYVTKQFLFKEENVQKLRAIAQYILHNARENHLITFKKTSKGTSEFHLIGNWRDSKEAFPYQKSPLAPYDVNCIFYPESLRIIRKYHILFDIKNVEELDNLIIKWSRNKDKYRLYHPNDIIGYSLALHSTKNLPLPISHLDEAYDLFFNAPSLEEIESFAQKLTDPDYFYTPAGPLLVAADTEGLTEKNYHGKVIWPKQAAFAVAGLSRQYRIGIREGWRGPFLYTIADAIAKTCQACFTGWTQLGSIPELYYFDQKKRRARLYTDQKNIEGQMSIIQLWSAVGARRIIREYEYIMNQ